MDGQALPLFLQLGSEPLRWSLLVALAGSDRQVDELAGRLGKPQSLISYHLKRLKEGGLLSSRSSAHDRRATYYSLDLSRCAELFSAAGGTLHPALAGIAEPVASAPIRLAHGPRVLFLCTANSARSQMAEAFLRAGSAGTARVESAGVEPSAVHPHAVEAMRQAGLDISGQRSKHLNTLRGRRFDLVVTVCDRVRERCPEFPGAPGRKHWSIPDPATSADGQAAFERTAAEISSRVRFLVLELAARARRIGTASGEATIAGQ
jgi:protein-tyrosine-phosphatase/DNA-binding transcriptional ArsR family regulator